jgi:hypothetical protein
MGDVEVFGMCRARCLYPVYSKEQTMSLLQQLMESGSFAGCDPSLSPVVKLVQEQHGGKQLSLWLGTEAEYNALRPQPAASIVMMRVDAKGQLYLCTDDSTFQSWYNKIMQDAAASIEETAAEAVASIEQIANPLIAEMKQLAASVDVTADRAMYLSVTASGGLRISY